MRMDYYTFSKSIVIKYYILKDNKSLHQSRKNSQTFSTWIENV